MGVNKETAKRVAKKPYTEYVTYRGNSYMAIPLVDKKGRPHGTAVYRKQNIEQEEKPVFVCYLPDEKFALG